MSDASGNLVGETTRYLPFGGYRAGGGPTPITRHAYTSQRENMDIGLYYYNARYYAPTLARFLSPDTLIPDPANPQAFNRYSYVENRPLNFNDPTGHCKRPGDCLVTGGNGYSYPEETADAIIRTFPRDDQPMAATRAQYGQYTGQWDAAFRLINDGVDVFLSTKEFLNGDASATEFAVNVLLAALPLVSSQTDNIFRGLFRASDKVIDGLQGICSFSSDTEVVTADGLRPISEVTLWDEVLAYNEETGEIGYYPVIAVWEHLDPVIVTLTIDGEEIETTPEHPFYTIEGEWLPAAALQIGDELRTATWDAGTVEAIHFTIDPQPMYNFTVATAHTYFVGNGRWLVHNSCLNEFLSKVTPSSRSGTRAIIGEVPGDINEAERMFHSLVNRETIEWLPNQNRFRGFTSDGYEVGFRPITKSGTPAIDLHSLYEAGLSDYKWIHVTPP